MAKQREQTNAKVDNFEIVNRTLNHSRTSKGIQVSNAWWQIKQAILIRSQVQTIPQKTEVQIVSRKEHTVNYKLRIVVHRQIIKWNSVFKSVDQKSSVKKWKNRAASSLFHHFNIPRHFWWFPIHNLSCSLLYIFYNLMQIHNPYIIIEVYLNKLYYTKVFR